VVDKWIVEVYRQNAWGDSESAWHRTLTLMAEFETWDAAQAGIEANLLRYPNDHEPRRIVKAKVQLEAAQKIERLRAVISSILTQGMSLGNENAAKQVLEETK